MIAAGGRRRPPRPEPRTVLTHTEQDQVARARGRQYNVGRTAVARMLSLNTRHAEHAWQRRRRDPIAAHALALLFAETNPDFTAPQGRLLSGDDWAGAAHVTAATRVWLAGPETDDLTEMLYRLEQQILTDRHADGWTLREHLTTSLDDDLSTDAAWVGIGISSLDTPTGRWATVADTATNEAYVPGTIRLLLDVAPPGMPPEHAWIVGERRGVGESNTRALHSTHRLSDIDFNAPFNYGTTTAYDLFANPWHAPVLERLYGLDAALRACDHFTQPLGRPAAGSLWRHAAQQTHRRHP